MRLRAAALLAAGFVAGVLLAPKKGSESQKVLKEKVNEIYLQVKELDMDSLKDRVEEIKIEVTKMDVNTSKEFVSKQTAVVKEKLLQVVQDLQENKKIQPALSNAIDKTEGIINDTIDYIDENDLVNKAKDNVNKASDKAKEVLEKTGEASEALKEKSVDYIEKKTDDAKEVIEKAKNKISKD